MEKELKEQGRKSVRRIIWSKAKGKRDADLRPCVYSLCLVNGPKHKAERDRCAEAARYPVDRLGLGLG